MEFLRFGSSIPGSYWGCCAVDIIQNFKFDPDDKASIQLVSGDGGGPIFDNKQNPLFAGPTYKDIFLQRIRIGTFSNRDMPNHAFLAILTDWQVNSNIGMKWLKILRETGFEFVRSVANSVYTGQMVAENLTGSGQKLNYIFGLFRNIGTGAPADPFTPPKAWSDLPTVTREAWTEIADPKGLAKEQFASQKTVWEKPGPAKFLTEEELIKAGAPVVLAGLRSENPQEPKAAREARREGAQRKGGIAPGNDQPAPSVDPFAYVAKAPPVKAVA